MEVLKVYSQDVEVAEVTQNGNLKLKFIICDFDPNRNNVALNRDTIDAWKDTIVNQPLVGKIRANGKDFMGHEMRIVSKRNSETGEIEREAVFDTSAFGVFLDVDISEIDGKEYLVADAEVWARYPRALDIIKKRIESEEGLHTSWEIRVLKSHMDNGVKILDDGVFTAHCLLGADRVPAYGCSGYVEAASASDCADDEELYEAITMDVASQEERDMEEFTVTVAEEETPAVVEENTPAEETKVGEQAATEPETSEQTVEEPAPEEPQTEETEVSSLTDNDIRKKLNEAYHAKHKDDYGYLSVWYPSDFYALFHSYKDNDMDFTAVTYAVADDEVEIVEEVPVTLVVGIREINSAMAEKDASLLKASEKIRELEEENATLRPFKEAADKAKAEKEEAEKAEKVEALRTYATHSGYISQEEAEAGSDSPVAQMIAELDEAGVKALIVERFMKKLETSEQAETEVKDETPVVSEHETASLIEDAARQEINPIMVYLNNM